MRTRPGISTATVSWSSSTISWRDHRKLLLRALLLNNAIRCITVVDNEVGQNAQDDENGRQSPRGLFEDVGRCSGTKNLLSCTARRDTCQTATFSTLEEDHEGQEDPDNGDYYD